MTEIGLAFAWQWLEGEGLGEKFQTDTKRKLLGVETMLLILVVIKVSQMYVCQNIKFAQSIACQLYLSKLLNK